jgi:hypothetical protein
MSFDLKAYLRARYDHRVAARQCIHCDAKHDGSHVRCATCHRLHLEESRLSYAPRGTGHMCSACGNTGHNRRTCVA